MAGSSTQTEPDASPEPGPGEVVKTYKCGSLTYAKAGLFMLFGWLLWGDFCFTMMETVAQTIMPLKLKSLGVSNTTWSIILASLPAVLNMTVCPWVSFRSDRHRSRWGRRIPFILKTMPFLVLSLGWGDTLAPMLQGGLPFLKSVPPVTMLLTFLVTLWLIFKFFDMFVNSVFWYLFNDVVPTQFLGRFYGLFRTVSIGTTALYNNYVYKFAETHMREIFTGAAIVYCVGFTLMCLFVKEGKYPPPPDQDRSKDLLSGIKTMGKQSFSSPFHWYFYLVKAFLQDRSMGLISSIKTMGKQSFSKRFYWYFYLMNAFLGLGALAGLNTTTYYGSFFYKEMGLAPEQMGRLVAYGMLAGLVESYITSIFVDRWHPLRIYAYLAVFTAATGFSNWVWLFVSVPGQVFFWITLGLVMVGTFQVSLQQGCSIPLFMRLMPKSLYGQFSSANSIVRSAAIIVGAPLLGLCMDGISILCSNYGFGETFYYRFIFIWPWVCNCLGAVFVCLGYREWKRLGGDDHYRPPAPWTKEGYEEV